MDAVLEVWPSNRVAVRYAPSGGAYGVKDSNYEALFGYVAEETEKRKLAYISISEVSNRNWPFRFFISIYKY